MSSKHRSIVIPGEPIVKGARWKTEFGTYKDGDVVRAYIMGIAHIDFRKRTVKVIPLRYHQYIPRVGDIVIGKVVDYGPVAWYIDIGADQVARLDAIDFLGRPMDPMRENIRSFLDVGDVICAKVILAERGALPQLSAAASDLGKLVGGKLIFVNITKIPAIIGKQGKLINMVKQLTHADIRVGANGVIWIKADPEIMKIVEGAIRLIEREAHVPDLYSRVRSYINRELQRLRSRRRI